LWGITSYVYFLETRITYLEELLEKNSIPFTPAENLDLSSRPGGPAPKQIHFPTGGEKQHHAAHSAAHGHSSHGHSKQSSMDKLNNLVTDIGMVSVQGTSDPRFLGSTSGISFARVVLSAIKQSVSSGGSEKSSIKPSRIPGPGQSHQQHNGSMRDSFFGLHKKPTIKQAPFPDRDIGYKLIELYFQHANPQTPILHEPQFMKIVDRVYSSSERDRTSRELYLLNIVFAIGAGIFLNGPEGNTSPPMSPSNPRSVTSPTTKRMKLTENKHEPEEYYASAIVHLESFLSSTSPVERDGFVGSLEELQAVLLLAGFALLRPIAPGLWYIVGVAVRLALDLGLHYEDGTGLDATNHNQVALGVKQAHFIGPGRGKLDSTESGRREWLRDTRRRLFWWYVLLNR
jgi:hypothetical protein